MIVRGFDCRRRLARVAAGTLALALPVALGCAQLGLGGATRRAATAVRPGAPPDYDFAVGRSFELDGRLADAAAAYQRAADKDPTSAYLQRKLAELAARQGQYAEALAHAERAHVLAPDDLGSRLFLGTLYRVRKDAASAERVLRTPQGEPIDGDAGLLLFSIYLEAQRHAEALATAEWLVRQDPTSLRGHLALAAAHERLGRPAEAERALRAALKQHPGSLAVYGALARGRQERGDREGEIAIYREVLSAHPNHHATLVALSDALVSLGRNDEAIRVLERVERHHPEDLRSIIRLGFLEYEAKRFEAAAQRFERTLAAHPDQHEIAYFLGLVRRRAGDDEAAAVALERVPAEHERYAEARTQLAGIHESRGGFRAAIEEVERARARQPARALDLYLASLRAKSGDFDGAVSFLQGLIAQAPDDDELLYNLGVVYGEAKRYDEALRYMHLALEKNPDNASALNYIGYSWAEKGQNLDEAEAMIQRALSLRPDDGYITDSLGWVYYMRARPLFQSGRVKDARPLLERAVRELERAAQLTGGDPVISEHLGDAYLLLDEKRRALEKYREALGLDPREAEQPQLRQKYESLRRELGAQ